MKLAVTNSIVFNNIKLFKEMIRDFHRTQLEQYHLFINRKTGELLFVEKAPDEKKVDLTKWKPISFFFHAQEGFEVREEETHKTLERCFDLEPQALRLLDQMIEALNCVVKKAKHPTDLKEVLREILLTELERAQTNAPLKDVVHDAWHSVDREGAEELLAEQPQGTYLFRKDEFATILEEQLSSRLRTPLKCFTLSYLGPNGKVGDLTLVRKNHLWYVYDDDPTLEETAYSNIPALIENLDITLLAPLLFAQE